MLGFIMSPNIVLFKHCNADIAYQAQCLTNSDMDLAICMSEYSGVKIFDFPNLVCFFKEMQVKTIGH